MAYELKNFPQSYTAAAIVLVAILYLFIGALGLLLAIPGTTVSPIWPAAGLALAAVIVLGHRILPAIFFGSCVMNVFALHALAPAAPLWKIVFASALTGLGAAFQAFIGGAVIKRTVALQNFFQHPLVTLEFLGIGIGSCFINATIGVLSITLTGFISWQDFLNAWQAWFIGDSTGVVVVTPLILSWIKCPIKNLSFKRIVEAIFLFLLILFVTVLVNILHKSPLLYLFLPCLIWAAVRFGFSGATLAILMTVFSVILITARNYGPLAQSDLSEALLFIGLFSTVVTATILSLTAELNKEKEEQHVWKGKPISHSWKQSILNWLKFRK